MSRRKDGQKEKEEQDDDDDDDDDGDENDGESCWLNNFDTKLDESIKNLKMMKMMKKEADEVKSFPFKVKVDFLFAISIRMWPENSN